MAIKRSVKKSVNKRSVKKSVKKSIKRSIKKSAKKSIKRSVKRSKKGKCYVIYGSGFMPQKAKEESALKLIKSLKDKGFTPKKHLIASVRCPRVKPSSLRGFDIVNPSQSFPPPLRAYLKKQLHEKLPVHR